METTGHAVVLTGENLRPLLEGSDVVVDGLRDLVGLVVVDPDASARRHERRPVVQVGETGVVAVPAIHEEQADRVTPPEPHGFVAPHHPGNHHVEDAVDGQLVSMLIVKT